MRNLHPGCIFGHVNDVLRICTRVQICSNSRGSANLHPGANCAHERKMFLYILIGDFDLWQAFSITILYKTDIKMDLKLFFIKINIRVFIMADQTTK